MSKELFNTLAKEQQPVAFQIITGFTRGVLFISEGYLETKHYFFLVLVFRFCTCLQSIASCEQSANNTFEVDYESDLSKNLFKLGPSVIFKFYVCSINSVRRADCTKLHAYVKVQRLRVTWLQHDRFQANAYQIHHFNLCKAVQYNTTLQDKQYYLIPNTTSTKYLVQLHNCSPDKRKCICKGRNSLPLSLAAGDRVLFIQEL